MEDDRESAAASQGEGPQPGKAPAPRALADGLPEADLLGCDAEGLTPIGLAVERGLEDLGVAECSSAGVLERSSVCHFVNGASQ